MHPVGQSVTVGNSADACTSRICRFLLLSIILMFQVWSQITFPLPSPLRSQQGSLLRVLQRHPKISWGLHSLRNYVEDLEQTAG